jgi:hypothetical protein
MTAFGMDFEDAYGLFETRIRLSGRGNPFSEIRHWLFERGIPF